MIFFFFLQQALVKYAELWKFSQGTSTWTTSLKKPALKSHCVNLFLHVVLIESADPIVPPPEQLSSMKCSCTSSFLSPNQASVWWTSGLLRRMKLPKRTDSEVVVPLCMCLHLINCPYISTPNLDRITFCRCRPKGMQYWLGVIRRHRPPVLTSSWTLFNQK